MKLKEKKKRLKIILPIVLAVIVGILAVLFFRYRTTVEALLLLSRHNKTEIAEMAQEDVLEIAKETAGHKEALPRELTEEEMAKIQSGELSVEEATELLLSDPEESDPAPQTPVSEGKTPAEKAPDAKENTDRHNPHGSALSKEDEIIRRYTAKLYSLNAYYDGQLKQIEASARAELSGMTADQRKTLSKASFVARYAGRASSLMGECDATVSGVLADLKKELSAIGGDVSIVSTLRQAYESAKAAKTAYYMNLVS